jgi:hypothetical protein
MFLFFHLTTGPAAAAAAHRQEAVMSTAIPSQPPAVVLRSQYNRLRNLLAIAMIAVVGLSVAVVVVSSDDAPSTSDVIFTGKLAPAKTPSGTTRYDGGPEEGTRGAASVSSAPVPTVAPPPSSIAAASQAEYEAMRKAQPNTRYDGGPEEGTRGLTQSGSDNSTSGPVPFGGARP